MQKAKETHLNKSPFDAGIERWERRLNIIAWGILGFAVTYYAPIIIRAFCR